MGISFTKFCELLIRNQILLLICTNFDFQMQLSIFFGKRHNEDIKPYHFTETVKICLVRFQKKKQNLLIFF